MRAAGLLCCVLWISLESVFRNTQSTFICCTAPIRLTHSSARHHLIRFDLISREPVILSHLISSQIPGLKEDYKSLNLHINIAGLIMEGSGAPGFRKRWQTERAMLEGEDCCEVRCAASRGGAKHCSGCSNRSR